MDSALNVNDSMALNEYTLNEYTLNEFTLFPIPLFQTVISITERSIEWTWL